jgi:hypothetical protein
MCDAQWSLWLIWMSPVLLQRVEQAVHGLHVRRLNTNHCQSTYIILCFATVSRNASGSHEELSQDNLPWHVIKIDCSQIRYVVQNRTVLGMRRPYQWQLHPT